MRRYDDSRAFAICRAALARGPLVRAKYTWRIDDGNRHFPLHIVRALIEAGEAIVIGEHCVSWGQNA